MMKISGKPDKWDIYDAHKEGINLQKFIQENINEKSNDVAVQTNDNNAHVQGAEDGGKNGQARVESSEIQRAHFLHLGFDESKHYFLPKGANIVKRISQGSFNKTKLLELAPLSWWTMQYPAKNGIDVDVAIDKTIRDSELHGIFQPSRIRGTGVWMHGGRLVVNNGDGVTDEYGSPITPDTQFHYVKSDKRMGDFSGEISTVEQGYKLTELFTTQGFETEFEALSLLGWTLIAPFGGILRWRPHVWLTGPAKSGKSWILENIIQPMVSPFFHRGTGKTSSPGIYRSIKNTACPILLDEMEPGKNANKETIQKIEEKLELARNASSDFSSVFTLTSMSGSGLTEEFCVRSCFCFASILPYFSGEAIESRIILSRLKNIKLTKNKIAKTRELMAGGVMADPMIYQRRIFRKLKSIIKNIDVANEIFMHETGDQRKSDNLAPIFSAIYALLNDSETADVQKMKNLISTFINELTIDKSATESDEDRLVFELLDYTIQLSPGERVSIAELILEASNQAERISDERHSALQRHGIRTIVIDGTVYLAIASSHSAIKRILSDTMYHSNYYEVLKRHEAKRITQTARFAGQAKRAVLLDWNIIKERYFTERNDDDQTPSLFVNEALNVF
jgi:putative DNA primase/helicase